jgi:hypothetical protein
MTSHPNFAGDIKDEFAALASLLSGTRILAAHNYSRRYGFNDDPLGQPIHTHDTLVVPKYSLSAPAICAALRLRDLFRRHLLAALPSLTPQGSVVLAQSAALYQQALWYAEVNQHYTWLMLVSALETVAGYWSRELATPVERLRQSRPNLEALLLKVGGEELVQRVAAEIADYMGATKKFVDFLLAFMPAAASAKKAQPFQEWSTSQRKKVFAEIYALRSRALHGGLPFPNRGPTTLETFEDIARGAILNWWETQLTSLETQETPRSAQHIDAVDDASRRR